MAKVKIKKESGPEPKEKIIIGDKKDFEKYNNQSPLVIQKDGVYRNDLGISFKFGPKPKPTPKPKELPTIYINSPKDKRVKAYQDSLYNYNSTESLRKLMSTAGKIPQKQFMKNKEEYFKKYSKGVFGNMDPIGYEKHTDGPSLPVYKKPVQPVEYRKPEEVKQNTPTPSTQVSSAMNYNGEPVYHYTDSGKGLIGFMKNGSMTPIAKEDYDRFAVSKESRTMLENKQLLDSYMESKLGKFYKK